MKLLGKEPEFQIQIVMDSDAYDVLVWLQVTLDASSANEVVRRAIQAYEFFEPEDWNISIRGTNLHVAEVSSPSGDKKVHIRLPKRTKDLLDRHKGVSGEPYSVVISKALSVFAELVARREEAKTSTENGVGFIGLCSEVSMENVEDHTAARILAAV